MAPSPLHGLNIVQTEGPDQYADNTQDPLLGNAHFPELAAQLDLWSSLNFHTDEPPLSPRKPSSRDNDDQAGSVDDDKDDDAAEVEGPAPLDAHVNAVNPTAVSNPPQSPQPNQQPAAGLPPHLNYDMSALLAGFGIEPYLIPQLASQAVPPPQPATLVQLLASYPFAAAAAAGGASPFLPHLHAQGISPAALFTATQQQQQQAGLSPSVSSSTESTTQTRRGSRQRKSTTSAMSPTNASSANGDEGDEAESISAGGQVLSAAEDKRRRNTAASARFRLKKKEREAALERRAQELEGRVNALERECEGLRRENGWLKGLVVGVTGASQGASVVPPKSPARPQGQNSNGSGNGNGATSGKRKRSAEESLKEEKVETKKVATAAA